MKLVKVIYIGRHGERGPLCIPSSLKKDWEVIGMLTPKGEETQYKRGQHMREKYKDLLSASDTRVMCQSSYVDRTIDSGFCLLSGLFGHPFTSPRTVAREEKIAFLGTHGAQLKPWDVDVVYRGYHENITPAATGIYAELNKAAHDKKDYYDLLMPIHPLAVETLERKSTSLDYFDIYSLYDLLECYRANDKEFPEGFKDGKLYKDISFIHHYLLFNLMMSSQVLRRVTNYYVYKQVVEVITEMKGRVFCYYSSHDSNILAFILGLGYDVGEVPYYSSGITIEIYESPEGQFANLDYREQNLNKKIFPELKSEYIPLADLLEKFSKERFKDDEEYRKYSGNKDFDYIRDYVNAKPIIVQSSALNEQKQLDILFKKSTP